jgi:hypothetical protein
MADNKHIEVQLEAYKQANADQRHYSDLRWKIVTIYLVVTTALFALGLHPDVRPTAAFWFPMAGGLLVSCFFYVMEMRINKGLEDFRDGIIQLEISLGIAPITTAQTPAERKVRKYLAPTLVGGLYLGVGVLWIAAICFRAGLRPLDV